MSLKPPKYLYLRAKEFKTRLLGFTTIELTNNRKYKPKRYRLEAEVTSDEWTHSWKQVLRLSQTHNFTLNILRTRANFQRVWAKSQIFVVCESGKMRVGSTKQKRRLKVQFKRMWAH